MNAAARIGRYTLDKWEELRYLAAVLWGVLATAVRRSSWKRTVRGELIRQIFASGVGASRFITLIAFALGVSVVAQALVWTQKIGQTGLLGPLLVTVLIREAIPVLTNLLVIARNGTALATELGTMKVSGEVRMLDAQGLDPFIYLVVPRVIGIVTAVCCLSVLFLVGAFASGYLFSLLLSPDIEDAASFFHSILVSVSWLDLVNFAAKSLFPALLTGVICCTEGLGVGASASEVPTATRRALARSARTLFLISALISFLTYI